MPTSNEILTAIAKYCGFEVEAFITAYHAAPGIGGFDGTVDTPWPIGSILEEDGRVLYALVRLLQPAQCLEVGTYYGCSARYIIAALKANGKGWLTCIDNGDSGGKGPQFTDTEKESAEFTRMNLFDYQLPDQSIDFVFEDAMHSSAQVAHIWTQFVEKGLPGGIIVSHDAGHQGVGAMVRAGIEQATKDYRVFDVDPGPCGVGIWHKPKHN